MWLRHLLLTLLLLAGWAIAGYYFADYTLESPKRDQPVEIEIPENTTLDEIGQLLAEKNLIRQSWFFSVHVWWSEQTHLLAGVYEIAPNENLPSILARMSEGKQNLVKVTIPEGKTVIEIADILEEKGFFKKEAFLQEVNRPKEEAVYDFEKQIQSNPKRVYRLEGYLFPSTYLFRKENTAKQVVDEMLGEFEKQIKEILGEDQLAQANLTMDEWVTFASVVEKEGRVKKELPRIAGVIRNRLQINMKLQVDATVIYAFELKGEKKKRLYFKDLDIVSPFNTYTNKGLPVGPIANPGEAALLAALKPENNDYLYYVTKKNGTFEHYFSKTYEEHEKMILMSEQNQGKN